MKHAISKITPHELTHDQFAIINNKKTLLDFRSGYINIDGFNIDNVNQLCFKQLKHVVGNFLNIFVMFKMSKY